MERTKIHFEALKKKLAMNLFGIGAIKFGTFRLKLHDTNPTAPLSPIYINLRIVKSFPIIFLRVVRLLEKIVIHDLNFDLVCDIPTASTPFVAAIAVELGLPMISPAITKAHGLAGEIDGLYQPGQKVLLVDDVITNADSKLEIIKILEDNGLVVKDVLVVVDRGQGGKEKLEQAGYRLHSLFGIKEMLSLYLHEAFISQEQHDKAIAYLKATAN